MSTSPTSSPATSPTSSPITPTLTLPRIAIVGAGLAGLTAARRLVDAGLDVTVVDKGRSVGGRLATRRIGDAVLDHGAQFFTVRGDDFRGVIDPLIAEDLVYTWCHGFAEQDGYPRYAVRGGMNKMAKRMAEGLPVQTSVHLTEIRSTPGGFDLIHQGGTIEADLVISTAPVAQLLALHPAASTTGIDALDYFHTLGLLCTLDGPSAVPAPGGVQLDEGMFTFISDNQQKGISPTPALTFHAEHDISRDRYDDDPDEVLAALLAAAAPWFGDAAVVDAQLKKWRYAGPISPHPSRVVVHTTAHGHDLLMAGDAFGGPKVEGAFNSGWAAAQQVLDNLT